MKETLLAFSVPILCVLVCLGGMAHTLLGL